MFYRGEGPGYVKIFKSIFFRDQAGEHTGKRELEDLEEFVEQQLHEDDDDKVENEADDA